MAVSESIRAALNDLIDEVLTARCTADAWSTLHSQIQAAPPPLIDDNAWVFVVARMVERLSNASEKLEEELNRRAFPLLEEMEELTQRGRV